MTATLNRPTYFASVGDVHGEFIKMVRLITDWDINERKKIDFVLQIGDFEPHRNEFDLQTMAAPAKYRKLGDFSDFYNGRRQFPWPVYFIGGNHEPYGFLDQHPEGFQVARNCFYLGRVGMLNLHGKKIVGLSGIYREDHFRVQRPSVSEIGARSNKDYIYFTEEEVIAALSNENVDILLLHEWPAGIIKAEDEKEFEQQRRSLRYEDVGNEYAKMLLDLLEPKLVVCGHMHKKYRNALAHPSGKVTEVCCLASVEQGEEAVAIFQINDDLQIEEISI